jgi:hypothetical protein
LLSKDSETSRYTRERVRKRKLGVGLERDIPMRGVKKNISSLLKVPRQCPLVLVVCVMHIIKINSNLIFMALDRLH